MRNPMADEMIEPLQGALATARRLGAEGARLAFHQGESAGCEFEGGRLKTAESTQSISFHATVLADRRLGSATGNRRDELDKLVERAVAVAKVGSEAHFASWPPEGDVPEVATWAESTLDLDRETMVEACERIVEPLREARSDLYLEAGAERRESESVLLTSGGTCHTMRRTLWSLGGRAQRTKDTDMLFAGDARRWREMGDFWAPDEIAGEVLQDLRRAESQVEAPEGKVTAIWHPKALGRLLSAVFMGTNGRNVVKGDSPLAGRLGEKILADTITIHDNPHRDFAPGAVPLDADGIPTRPMMIVRRGVLEAFLYDLDTAGMADVSPTGHNGCTPYEVEVLPGETSSEALISGIDDGLYVKNLIGFGQSNLINGDFSANLALGFRIRDGRIVGRVKDTMIAGNVYELLGGEVALSSDRDPLRHLPYARTEGLAVSARS